MRRVAGGRVTRSSGARELHGGCRILDDLRIRGVECDRQIRCVSRRGDVSIAQIEAQQIRCRKFRRPVAMSRTYVRSRVRTERLQSRRRRLGGLVQRRGRRSPKPQVGVRFPGPPLDPGRDLRPRRPPARLGVRMGRRPQGTRRRARAPVAGRRDGGDARHERAGVVALRARGARRAARAAGDLRPRRRARAALLRRGAAAARRRGSGRGADRCALAAGAGVVLQQGGHRARDGHLGLGRGLP